MSGQINRCFDADTFRIDQRVVGVLNVLRRGAGVVIKRQIIHHAVDARIRASRPEFDGYIAAVVWHICLSGGVEVYCDQGLQMATGWSFWSDVKLHRKHLRRAVARQKADPAAWGCQ